MSRYQQNLYRKTLSHIQEVLGREATEAEADQAYQLALKARTPKFTPLHEKIFGKPCGLRCDPDEAAYYASIGMEY